MQAPASAHYVYENVDVWNGPNGYCLETRAEISDGPTGEGFTKSTSLAYKPVFTPYFFPCFIEWKLSSGRLAVTSQLWYWDYMYDVRWEVCSTLPWVYNQTAVNIIAQNKTWGPKCTSKWPNNGTTWYQDLSGSFVYNDAGSGLEWHGGYQFSGMHWLPAYPN